MDKKMSTTKYSRETITKRFYKILINLKEENIEEIIKFLY